MNTVEYKTRFSGERLEIVVVSTSVATGVETVETMATMVMAIMEMGMAMVEMAVMVGMAVTAGMAAMVVTVEIMEEVSMVKNNYHLTLCITILIL